jgi:type VI secretion system protein
MSPNQGRWRTRVAVALALAVLLGLALSACGSYTFIRSLGGRQVRVSVVNTERANLNHPVAMDFVLVFSEKMETEVLKLTARQWFEKKAQFRRDYIENEHYLLFQYEFVPGETEPVIEVPYTVSGRSLVLFADYLTPGEHRVRVDPHKDLTITLLERNFSVQLKEP